MRTAILVPTRGRPENMKRLMQAWVDTGATSELVFGMDHDDDVTRARGDELIDFANSLSLGDRLCTYSCERTSMNGTLNWLARIHAPKCDVLGFMGDDHCPRTASWDEKIRSHLVGGPCRIAYGNDLMQGPLLPTAVFMTADIVRMLGYMSPPVLRHLFLDNAWKTWGERLGTLRYFDDVIIEHMHPQAGTVAKADWDEGYERVNSGEMWKHDEGMWKLYERSPDGLEADIAKLKEAMA